MDRLEMLYDQLSENRREKQLIDEELANLRHRIQFKRLIKSFFL